jgi:hypothetical protein
MEPEEKECEGVEWSGVDSYSSEHGQVSGSCKHGKHPLGSIYKARNL